MFKLPKLITKISTSFVIGFFLLEVLSKVVGGNINNIDPELLRYLQRENITVDDFQRWFNMGTLSPEARELLLSRLNWYLQYATLQGNQITFPNSAGLSRIGQGYLDPRFQSLLYDFPNKKVYNAQIHNLQNITLAEGFNSYRFSFQTELPQDAAISLMPIEVAGHTFTPSGKVEIDTMLDLYTTSHHDQNILVFYESIGTIIHGKLETGQQVELTRWYDTNHWLDRKESFIYYYLRILTEEDEVIPIITFNHPEIFNIDLSQARPEVDSILNIIPGQES